MPEILQDMLLIDIPIFGIIIFFYFYQPEKINPLMGYKTARSMKNEKNWKFAQKYSSKRLIFAIPAMLVCQAPVLFGIRSEWLIHSSVILLILIAIYIIYLTEKALIKVEKENG